MLEILRDRDVEFDVVEYLKHPLSRADLERIVDAIPDDPGALVRRDKRFAELELDPARLTTKDAVVSLLLEHPVLMERPVVFRGDEARICRPSEIVLELVD